MFTRKMIKVSMTLALAAANFSPLAHATTLMPGDGKVTILPDREPKPDTGCKCGCCKVPTYHIQPVRSISSLPVSDRMTANEVVAIGPGFPPMPLPQPPQFPQPLPQPLPMPPLTPTIPNIPSAPTPAPVPAQPQAVRLS